MLRVFQYTLILCSERDDRLELGREEAGVLLGHLPWRVPQQWHFHLGDRPGAGLLL